MNELDQEEKHSNPQLNNHNHENKIYQNGKFKSLDSQHTSNNYFPQQFVDQHKSTNNLSNETSSNHTDKNSNKDELSTNTDESDKSSMTMKKRVTPIPASYARRRPNLVNQSANTKLLLPHNKTKITNKKQSTPVFIAPKKTSPQRHSFSSLSFDDSLQIKPKPILERQIASVDDNNSSSMTNWTPAPPVRFHAHSSGSSLDEDSDDNEIDRESLLIRKKHPKIKKQQKFNFAIPIDSNTPSAIFITDPNGRSHTYDPDDDGAEDANISNEQTLDNVFNSTDTNTLDPNSTIDISSIPEIILIPPSPSIMLDKHTLHSIGEEEENEEENGNGNQTNLNVHEKDENQIDKEPLGRRWSDGVVDQENEQLLPSQTPLIKMASAASVTKQTETPPPKISKTKYLLMKLHLASSSKDDESNNSQPKKRIVRRSTDKKRYQTQ